MASVRPTISTAKVVGNSSRRNSGQCDGKSKFGGDAYSCFLTKFSKYGTRGSATNGNGHARVHLKAADAIESTSIEAFKFPVS
jgi:hypothetical protein